MKERRRWSQPALWVALVICVLVLGLLSLDRLGLGPNLGLPFGYYGRFNRVLEQIRANPDVEVVQTTLHRDQQLEDFTITVRTLDGRNVLLSFPEAHTRPYDELVRELKKIEP